MEKEHWTKRFRREFDWQEDQEFMPDGPRWDDIENFIQRLLDDAMYARAQSMVEDLECYTLGTNSLKQAIKAIKRAYKVVSPKA